MTTTNRTEMFQTVLSEYGRHYHALWWTSFKMISTKYHQLYKKVRTSLVLREKSSLKILYLMKIIYCVHDTLNM